MTGIGILKGTIPSFPVPPPSPLPDLFPALNILFTTISNLLSGMKKSPIETSQPSSTIVQTAQTGNPEIQKELVIADKLILEKMFLDSDTGSIHKINHAKFFFEKGNNVFEEERYALAILFYMRAWVFG